MRQILSRRIKLAPTEEQKEFLKKYFSDYAKVVNFAMRAVQSLRKEYTYIYKKEQIECVCGSCDKKVLLTHVLAPEQKKVCLKCYGACVGKMRVRKTIYATRGRKRGKYDIRDAAVLPGTDYDAAMTRAINTLDSLKKGNASKKRQLFFLNRRLTEWKQVLNNENIVVEDRVVSARILIPKKDGQKVNRFRHVLKDSRSKGKTETQIRREITALETTINRFDKRLKESRVDFNGTVVDLKRTAIKNITPQYIDVTIGGGMIQICFELPRNIKGKEWLGKVTQEIKENKKAYPFIHWGKRYDSFYLQYPITRELSEPTIEKSTRVMGIDRGVNQIAVSIILDSPNDKPRNIHFHSGGYLLGTKLKYQLIRKKFTGTKGVLKRRSKFGAKMARISKNLLHVIAKKIVSEAQQNQPIVIALEDLQMVQGTRKPRWGTSWQERRVRFLLSNFTYGTLQQFISYKALKAGIPVNYVNPDYTSQVCYVCGKTGERKQGFFKCTNLDCGKKINADLNAAINIANVLYKKLERDTIVGNGESQAIR